MPMRRERPSWSVLDFRRVTTRPALENSRSATSRATSSERRKAPAKPSSSSARSRSPTRVPGSLLEHALQVGDHGRRLGRLGRADRAADAGVGAPHQRGGGRRGQVGGLVGLGDDHQAAGDGGRLEARRRPARPGSRPRSSSLAGRATAPRRSQKLEKIAPAGGVGGDRRPRFALAGVGVVERRKYDSGCADICQWLGHIALAWARTQPITASVSRHTVGHQVPHGVRRRHQVHNPATGRPGRGRTRV